MPPREVTRTPSPVAREVSGPRRPDGLLGICPDTPPADERDTWKVVWSNGDEVYVEASDRADALIEAGLRHGPTRARVIHCVVYG